LLGSVLEGLPQIYIIIDVELLEHNSSNRRSWPTIFERLFHEMKMRSVQTVVKVAFICPQSRQRNRLEGMDREGVLVVPSERSNDLKVATRIQRAKIRKSRRAKLKNDVMDIDADLDIS
jgi:hypothetical protein